MRALCHFFLLSIVTKVRSVEEAKTTEVVSNAFVQSSLTAEEKMTKKTVDELHTFAELKRDPRAMLPETHLPYVPQVQFRIKIGQLSSPY